MSLNSSVTSVLTRPLPQDQIKNRPGKGGMVFNYISADLVIKLLNEAFDYDWNTTIFSQNIYENTVVVGLELTVRYTDNNYIHKQQFGSCDMGRGMGPGEAFKGAVSDALKKAATLLGLGLELYQDDVPSNPGPKLPQNVSRPSVPKKTHTVVNIPPTPRSVINPPKPNNPFAKKSSSPKPISMTVGEVKFPTKAPSLASPAPPRVNLFANTAGSVSGPNSTQINAMTNLAARKNFSQSEMIALANVVDEHDSPIQAFDELSHSQAIEVIKAAQL